MKKMLIAALFAVLSLGTNSFAYDDGYGNDDDYRSVRTVRNGAPPPQSDISRSRQFKPFNFGGVMGVGFGGLRNVSSRFEYNYGDYNYGIFDDWVGVDANLGMFMSINFFPMMSLVPELSFSMRDYFRDVDHYYGYTVQENNYFFGIEIPLLLHVNVLPNFYIEGGPQFSFKIADDHTYSYNDDYRGGEQVDEISWPGGWNFSSFRMAVDFGLGGTVRVDGQKIDMGVRLVFDLSDMEDHYYDHGDYEWMRGRFKNDTRMWVVKFVARWYAF